jgi:hypothetical protein
VVVILLETAEAGAVEAETETVAEVAAGLGLEVEAMSE